MVRLAFILLLNTLTGLAGSDILHLTGGGKDIIILNTVEVAKELLEKRSANYSSRWITSVLSS
jgi:hypothetical protein